MIRTLPFIIVTVGLLTVVGCGPAGSSPSLTNTLIYGRGGETDKLDPIHVDTGESVKVIVNLFDTLVTYANESVQIEPGLAERWEASDDGLRWTFYLRPGVKFHDGSLLTAEAVKFSIDRLITPNHSAVHWDVIPYAESYRDIAAVKALDERTVEFTLKQPSAVFLANLAMFPASIVSPQAVEKSGKEFAVKPVGTGPFRFVNWRRDEELTIAAFDDHWRGRPKLDRVIFVPVIESAVRIEQLKRGEIHIADDLPPAELATLEGEPGITVQRQDGMNVGYLSIQNDKPPLDNRKLREAIWYAIDKQRLIDVVYDGRAQAAINPVPPKMFAYNDSIRDRSFDINKAKSLVIEARKEAGFSLPLKLDLFVMASPRPYMQRPQETAVFIKQALEPIGIELRIVTNEITQHFQRLCRGEHQLALSGWFADNADPDNFLYHLLDPDNINDLGGNNTCRYRNPQVHEILLAAKRELDPAKRQTLYRQAQQIIFDDAPMVPLVHTDLTVSQRAELKGFRLHPTAMVYLRNAYLEKP